MTPNYADVARNAASLSLRVRRLANGETFQQDRDVLRSVAEKFRQFPDGPPTPDSDAEADVLAGLYGHFMLVKTLHEMDPGIWGVEQFKKRLEDYGAKLENLARNRAQEPEKEELKRFFQTLRELADELVATGREPNPVFEFYHMLYGKSAPDAAKAFVAITAERDEAARHLANMLVLLDSVSPSGRSALHPDEILAFDKARAWLSELGTEGIVPPVCFVQAEVKITPTKTKEDGK